MSDDNVSAAYASGRTTFLGLDLLVATGTLVPRAETELLATAAIEKLKEHGPRRARVIDMCCGAGNLACAIAHHLPGARVWAADLTEECVALAARNATHTQLAERITVHRGDLFDALSGQELEGTVDLIVCNPPYISSGRLSTELADLLLHEPAEAFAAGPYGIGIHMRVVRDALPLLKPAGFLFMEVGLGQDRQVQRLLERTGEYDEINVVANAEGNGRVVAGRKRRAVRA